MCRMALIPKDFKGEKAVGLLDVLEKSMGGDGNGFAWKDADGMGITKGLKIENKLIEQIHSTSEMILYHSRKTSAGGKTEENVHPFYTKFGDPEAPVLCHNGNWGDYKDFMKISVMLGDVPPKALTQWSDTRFMAALIGKLGAEALDLANSSVWILYYGDKAIVHVKSGSWQGFKRADGTFIYASEFPKTADYPQVIDFDSSTVVECRLDGFTIIEGGYKNEENKYTYGSSYSSYSSSSSDYAEHYYGSQGYSGRYGYKHDAKDIPKPKSLPLWKDGKYNGFDY